jgi:hypothetical protein
MKPTVAINDDTITVTNMIRIKDDTVHCRVTIYGDKIDVVVNTRGYVPNVRVADHIVMIDVKPIEERIFE